jgi:hypothetical protein
VGQVPTVYPLVLVFSGDVGRGLIALSLVIFVMEIYVCQAVLPAAVAVAALIIPAAGRIPAIPVPRFAAGMVAGRLMNPATGAGMEPATAGRRVRVVRVIVGAADQDKDCGGEIAPL